MAAEDQQQQISYGGQAVIEGVMIRSPKYVAVACRTPAAGGAFGLTTPIDVRTEPVQSLFNRQPWLRKIPLLRGFFALIEMLGIGLRALERSGNIAGAATALVLPLLGLASETPLPGTPKDPSAGHDGKGALNGPLMLGTIAVSFTIGIALFVLLPNWLADVIGRWLGFADNHLALNLVEGLIRLTIFVAYIGLIGLMPDIRRVFQYHGAEHKAVNGWEHGVPLTVEAVQGESVIHPRCGTNFAFLTIVLSVAVFAFLPWTPSILVRGGLRLLCLPLVAGIGFEIIRIVGKYRDVRWLQALILPGLALQKLTTREPQADMIEVSLASFKAVKLAQETGELRCFATLDGEHPLGTAVEAGDV